MKRVVIVIAAIAFVISAYFLIFDYLKKGGVKILDDKNSHISKDSQTYLHYKIFNKKLLEKYKIDYRSVISDDETLPKSPEKDLRKDAKYFITVLFDTQGSIKDISLSDPIEEHFDEKFLNDLKRKKFNGLKNAIIKAEEAFLDREIELKK